MLRVFLRWAGLVGLVMLSGCSAEEETAVAAVGAPAALPADAIVPLERSDTAWREQLTPMQYFVLRQAGTEQPFSSPLLREKHAGTFVCAGCELPLFDAATKFDSGTGWPSFWQPIAPGHVLTHRDLSYGMIREENVCARCGGHLGHVFHDGPRPTGLRYCINGEALQFVPAAATASP